MLVASDYPFLNILWTMFIAIGLLIWLVLLIMVLWDNFRRNDHSGWAKAGWTLFVIVFPLFGVLIYMVARPTMTEQDREMLAQYSEQSVRLQGGSKADEIAKLAELRDAGVISAEDFETLKRKAIVS